MRFLPSSVRKSKRKYPIRRDETGKTLRQSAFAMFGEGEGYDVVCQTLKISRRTAYRYRADWKSQPEKLEERYKLVKRLRDANHGLSDNLLNTLADHFSMSKEEVAARLMRPWGIKQIIMGGWERELQMKELSLAEARGVAALEIVRLFEKLGYNPEVMASVMIGLHQGLQASKTSPTE